MVAKPLCPLYKNIIKPLDRARYPELRQYLYYLPNKFRSQSRITRINCKPSKNGDKQQAI